MPTSSSPHERKDRLLRACLGRPVDVTPIWLMRQAGRALPEYRALRNKYSFLDLMRHAELCARVTMLPLEVLDVDAAIIFADIMTPVAGLGVEYRMVEGTGPIVAEPVTSAARLDSLGTTPASEALPQLFEAIKMVRGQVEGRVPLLGFAGAPFTLASYLIEGAPTRDFSRTKSLMRSEPGLWHGLMEKLSAVIIDYLEQQVHAGAQAFQLFDSWVGELSPDEFREFALPYSKRIFDETARLEVPRIYFGTKTAPFVQMMAAAGPDAVGVDWRISLSEAARRIGPGKAVQGNLNPEVLLGAPDEVVRQAGRVLSEAPESGFIFNLGHGVLPETPVGNLQLLVETVHGN